MIFLCFADDFSYDDLSYRLGAIQGNRGRECRRRGSSCSEAILISRIRVVRYIRIFEFSNIRAVYSLPFLAVWTAIACRHTRCPTGCHLYFVCATCENLFPVTPC